jgi:hypothetical protein
MYEDIELIIGEEKSLDVDLSISSELELVIDEGGSSPLPYYEGDYYVVPRKQEQVLETRNKSMREDVVIDAINYSEVSNPQGGKTATIGYE